MGLMNLMVTITHNDSCPEMLAAVRRGLFSTPTDEEFVEYLLQRKPKQQKRPAFEDHSLDVALFIIVFLFYNFSASLSLCWLCIPHVET